jgi:hypothetical protein
VGYVMTSCWWASAEVWGQKIVADNKMERFVQDVERASREVHALTQTQYEARSTRENVQKNSEARDRMRHWCLSS